MSEPNTNPLQEARSRYVPTEYSLTAEATHESRALLWLRRCYWPLIVALCFAYAWRPLGGGDDIWAHAAVGRWIWNHGEVPRQSLFLWGAPPTSWIAHSWLSQLAFYGLLQVGGPLLALLINVAMVAGTFFLLWRLWTRHAKPNILTPLFFACAIYAGSLRFHPRQELFTALFLVVLMAYLVAWSEGHIASGVRRGPQFLDATTFFIAGLFALWANLHGAVAMGVLILLLTVACDCVQDRFDLHARSLLGIAALCVLATLLNPYGAGLWQEILRPANSELFSSIDEWKPPLENRVLWSYAFAEFVLVAAALFAWRLNPQRRWSQVAWLLVMSVLFLRYRRHLWLLSLVSLCVLAANARFLDTQALWTWWRKTTKQPIVPISEKFRTLACGGVLFALVMWICLATPSNILPLRAASKNLPEGAARVVEARNLRGRLFNDYENSSYLQWRLNGPLASGTNQGQVLAKGRRPLYIDLLNAYPESLLRQYLEIWKFEPQKGQAEFERLGIGYVILGSEKRKSKIAKYLDKNAAWLRIYDAADGVVWMRRTPKNRRPQP